jgi:hypothetical protein
MSNIKQLRSRDSDEASPFTIAMAEWANAKLLSPARRQFQATRTITPPPNVTPSELRNGNCCERPRKP